jgi:hypothetical protein
MFKRQFERFFELHLGHFQGASNNYKGKGLQTKHWARANKPPTHTQILNSQKVRMYNN